MRLTRMPHIEVQVSINPISYITKVPSAIRKQTGIGAHNAKKRDLEQLTQGVKEWINAKYDLPRKKELRQNLCSGFWTKELVIGIIKHEEEIDLLKEAGVTILRLEDIISEMVVKQPLIKSAAGADLVDLMLIRK
jgi:hypothetical protein